MTGSSRQKINKETQALNDILDKVSLIDVYRTLYLKQHNKVFSKVDEIFPG